MGFLPLFAFQRDGLSKKKTLNDIGTFNSKVKQMREGVKGSAKWVKENGRYGLPVME